MSTPEQKWQLRCPKCGDKHWLDDIGGKRVGAGSKRVLGWCKPCKWFRMMILENVEVPAEGAASPQA